jgi:hypothetical protein
MEEYNSSSLGRSTDNEQHILLIDLYSACFAGRGFLFIEKEGVK